ncbi:hypothetical protein DMX73_03600 [Cutibacterium acnes]|nr:hypothetical protein EGX38_10720 [Cutibacterium acnes]PGF47393.1 hypothetical protein B1C73_03570 [Cutibacterium acnes subsp. acnes]RHW03773.1 hypothetical protein DXA85_04205 [Propionibacterium sp. KPL2009]REB84218.1 hypothetical protein CP884_08765 [Cutibacterium acnes]REL41589.1 hypothetical protein CJM40_03585 [Cutibacterium acnes]
MCWRLPARTCSTSSGTSIGMITISFIRWVLLPYRPKTTFTVAAPSPVVFRSIPTSGAHEAFET